MKCQACVIGTTARGWGGWGSTRERKGLSAPQVAYPPGSAQGLAPPGNRAVGNGRIFMAQR